MSQDIFSRESLPVTRIAYGLLPLQFGDLRLADGAGPHPLCVMIHGGCWRTNFTLDLTSLLCAALADAGIATWNVEYRRVGDSGGGWPGTFLDIAAAVDFVPVLARRYSLDAQRAVLMGHSAGGHLALWACSRPDLPASSALAVQPPYVPAGVVSLAGIPDLVQAQDIGVCGGMAARLLGGEPMDVPERYAEGSAVAGAQPQVPRVLIHGTQDLQVPIVTSERYVARAEAAGTRATLLTLDGADHFALIDPASAIWPSVEESVRWLIERADIA